jgi:hypothetical protein
MHVHVGSVALNRTQYTKYLLHALHVIILVVLSVTMLSATYIAGLYLK